MARRSTTASAAAPAPITRDTAVSSHTRLSTVKSRRAEGRDLIEPPYPAFSRACAVMRAKARFSRGARSFNSRACSPVSRVRICRPLRVICRMARLLSSASAVRTSSPSRSERSTSSTALLCFSPSRSAVYTMVTAVPSGAPATCKRSWCCLGCNPASSAADSLKYRKRRSS